MARICFSAGRLGANTALSDLARFRPPATALRTARPKPHQPYFALRIYLLYRPASPVTLTGLYIYPIKSLGGISLPEARVEARGLQHDRRWLLVDKTGQFLTQRTDATLALLAVALTPAGLTVTHRTRPELGTLLVPYAAPETAPVLVRIWDDTVPALPVGAAFDAWFSAAINRPARLVYMPDTTHRSVDPAYAPAEAIVSFADAYPFLIIGEAALAGLNARLLERHQPPVPMDRFRPNFVFSGGAEAHEEDGWADFQIGAIAFRGVKPCARCVVTTIDQATGQPSGKEPLRTLARYRAAGAKVLFGQNVIGCGEGIVRIGDPITPRS